MFSSESLIQLHVNINLFVYFVGMFVFFVCVCEWIFLFRHIILLTNNYDEYLFLFSYWNFFGLLESESTTTYIYYVDIDKLIFVYRVRIFHFHLVFGSLNIRQIGFFFLIRVSDRNLLLSHLTNIYL